MNNKIRLRLLAAVILFPALTFAKELTPMEAFIARVGETNTFVTINNLWQADNQFDKKALLEKVETVQPLTIDYSLVATFLQQKNMAISLVIPAVNGNSYTIDLAKYDFFTNDFQVHIRDSSANDPLFDYKPGLYYRGTVHGIPGSVAAFSFFNNEVFGVFSIPSVGNLTVVPNTMVSEYYTSNTHYILYNDNELKIKQFGPGCATDKLPVLPEAEARTTTTENNEVFSTCSEVRVFEQGDYDLYLKHGSSVTNTVNYLSALFNNQSTLYRNENIMTVLKYVLIDSVADVYSSMTGLADTSSGPFLDTFGKKTQNVLHGCDLAMLASTAQNGGYGALGGVAWLQTLCSTYRASRFSGPYAFCDLDNRTVVTNFPTFTWDVTVMTHEMGHIVGSPHTHACVWNPPGTGRTAIDGCYTLEGSCAMPVPQYPVGGGTIMSYCHLTSDGINFANGFGPQPGDSIRYYISHKFSATCGATYNPTSALVTAGRTLSANRECTDMTSGITYYWNDNNTASQADDTMVLMIKKNGNIIGDLNTATFSVTSGTLPGYGTNRGVNIHFPAGLSGVLTGAKAMQRYWQVTTITNPTTNVEVMFPFSLADTSDVDHSVPGTTPLSGFLMYKANSPVDPNPANGFAGATASNFSIYTNGTTPSTTNWSFTNIGTTYLAHMLMTNLSGGGSGFYTYNGTGFQNQAIVNADISIYPNPANDQWNVSVSKTSNAALSFQLYSADGKLIHAQSLAAGVNVINAASLPAGVYFYKIISSENTYTGNLIKK